jgi:hypothetical protein
MTRIERLRHEALESCRFRGHNMTRFNQADFYRDTIRYAHCKVCGMQVVINSRPAPNEINISGRAVALHCISTEVV